MRAYKKQLFSATILSSLSLFLFSGKATASWQWTKWNMTVNELEKAALSGGVALESEENCPVNKSNSGTSEYSVAYSSAYRAGNTSFVACYLFKGDRLSRINLFAKSIDRDQIFSALQDKYENYSVDSTLRNVGIIRYKWQSPEETITLTDSSRSPVHMAFPFVLAYQSKLEPSAKLLQDSF